MPVFFPLPIKVGAFVWAIPFFTPDMLFYVSSGDRRLILGLGTRWNGNALV